MYKKNTRIKHLDFMLIDIVCMEFALAATYFLRSSGGSIITQGRMYQVTGILLLIVNILVALLHESYKGILRRGCLKELYAAFLHTAIVVLITLFLLYLLRYTMHYSRSIFLMMWSFYLFFTYAARSWWKHHLRSRGKHDGGRRSLLVVARQEHAGTIAAHILDNNYESWRLNGLALPDGKMTEETVGGLPVVVCGNDILEYIRTQWVDEVFLDYRFGDAEMEYILAGCQEMGLTVHIKLSGNFLFGRKQRMERLGGYTVITSTDYTVTPGQAFYKRALDITGALVGLFITGISFLFVAPAIKLKSPGPVFFSQQRVGKNGKIFKIYKFRSMYMDAEERKKELMEQNDCGSDNIMFKMKDDPRIIKGVGHFIRRTSIDELPQFWNVLKGEMSLVGTRPPTLDEWERYDLHHRRRLAVKPGITGLWQVSGRSNITDFEEVVKLDTNYIENWSPGLDIRILFKTVEIVLKGEGAA